MDNFLHDTLGEVHLVSFLIGLSLFVMGLISMRFPPKNINHVYGYRTRRSMKDPESWKLAQKFATREMIRGGLIIIAFAFSGIIYSTSVITETIAGSLLMVVVIILLFWRTEKALKRNEKS